MKRLFTLAIVSLIASLTFAQAPAQKKAAAQSHKIEKLVSPAKLQKAMEAKNVQQLKAAAAQETSGSVLRQAKRIHTGAALKEITAAKTINANVRPVNFEANKPAANMAPRQNANGAAAVDKDAKGIITNVTGGESRVYTRAQAFYAYVSSGQIKYAYQSGNVSVIVDGKDFYIKDIICNIGVGTWVKGTLNEDGSKLVIPAGQMIYWSAQGGYGMTLNMGDYTQSGWIKNNNDITYTVNGNTLTLDGAHASVSGGYINFEDAVLGTFWTDDNTFAGYGEWSTVLTYDPSYVEPEKELVQLPNGAQTENWNMSGAALDENDNPVPFQNRAVKIAFVGNDVYLGGVFEDFPNSWIKGTKAGNKVTFSKFQYLGTYASTYEIWFLGSDGQSITDATATLALDGKTLTFTEALVANAATDKFLYLEWLEDIVVSAEAAEEPTITTLTASLPYANTFDTPEEQAEAAIYDANNDKKTFTFAAPSGGDNTTKAARYTYSSTNAGNDYVVFPGLTLKAGTSYAVSVDARSYGEDYPEKFEVVAGTEAKVSKLNISVIPATEVASKAYATYKAEFKPEADGVYYFAIHGISDPDQFYLYTDNFAVKENDMSAPMAPQNLVITPDPAATMHATIEFDAPATTLGGAAITEGLTYTVKRGQFVLAEDATATAGQHITIEDQFEEISTPGTFAYSAYVTLNGVASDVVSASAYVGEDLPNDVENLEAEDKNDKVALSWDAVSAEGSRGCVVVPENVTYNVYPVEMMEFFGMQFPSIDFENPYITELKETSAEVDFNTNEGEHAYSYFGVTAKNTAGETNGAMTALLTGAPYELPFVEDLPEGKLSHWWGADYDDNIYYAEGGLAVDNNQFVFMAPVAGWIELSSGKIALAGAEKPQLSFVYGGAGKLTVTVFSANKQIEEELTPGAEAKTASIDLAQFAAEPWVRFFITAEFEAAGQATVGSVIVMNMVEKDLEATLSAPAKVTLGNKATIKATVKNKGTEDAAGYAVKFYVNNEEIMTVTDVPTLDFFDTADFEAEVETSIFDEAGDQTVKVEVVFEGDEKPENNSAEATISLVAPSATPVLSVTAEDSAEGVLVGWTVNSDASQEVTEDFESYDISITQDKGTMGPWSAIDGDKEETYGWESASINWPYTGEPYAFAIMNFPEVFGAATDIVPSSGDQALMFMSTVNGNAADDWFISPELPGKAQTISFMARPMTANYGPETLEVMASTDGQNWTKVTSFNVIDEEFKEFTADLAEGTKYFALHYVSTDVFALFVDDLKYTVSGGTPTGFNIYVDEKLAGTANAEATSYKVTGLAAGQHKFSVTALYGTTESAPVSADITTAINAVLGNAAATEAYTISGMRTNAKNLKHGVYVINGKKVIK